MKYTAILYCVFWLNAGYSSEDPEIDAPLALWEDVIINGSRCDSLPKLDWLLRVAGPMYTAERSTFPKEAESNLCRLVQYFQESANSSALSMFCYAYCLENGIGTDQDVSKALSFYECSAETGNALARWYYGYCFEHGETPAQSIELAEVSRILAAASNNDWVAQCKRGVCLMYGDHVEVDQAAAARAFKASAHQGMRLAQFCYGYCLEHGMGRRQNIRKSTGYYRHCVHKGLTKAAYHSARSQIADFKDEIEGYKARFRIPPTYDSEIEELESSFHSFADEGNAYAQYHVAVRLAHGIGEQANIAEAIKYCKMAADTGHADAQYCYARCVFEGLDIEPDQNVGVIYFKRSADKGNMYAQHCYGNCLEYGIGVPKDMKAAAWYYKLAADQGLANSQVRYGICLLNGWGVTKNLIAGAEYCKLAAYQGDANGMKYHTYCIEHQIVLDEHGASWWKKERNAKLTKYTKGEYDSLYCHEMCDDILPGHRAADYFELRTKKGFIGDFTDCCYNPEKICVKKDVVKAAQYYKKSADERNAYGLYSYGCCLENGIGVTQRAENAAYYYRLSADQNHVDAQHSCGRYLENGITIPVNLVDAVKYYKFSADQGHANAQFRYGRYLEDRFSIVERSGVNSAYGSFDAIRYYKLSADQGHASAQRHYGRCLENGIGIQKDTWSAANFYRLSARQGDAYAQYDYARCLENGIGVEKDVRQAVAYYEMSADQGNVEALCSYGRCFYYGIGVTRNVPMAAQFYKSSADSGFAEAQYRYARCLEKGRCNLAFFRGVRPRDEVQRNTITRNMDEAVRYYKLSADQGNFDARTRLLAIRRVNFSYGCATVFVAASIVYLIVRYGVGIAMF